MYAIQWVNEKDKYLSVFELGMVVGASYTGCVKNCNTAGFFMLRLSSFPWVAMVHHPKDIQQT
jgi:hypothetical protein